MELPPKAFALPILTSPLIIGKPPVMALSPERISVPSPCLVRPFVPVIAVEMVAVPVATEIILFALSPPKLIEAPGCKSCST